MHANRSGKYPAARENVSFDEIRKKICHILVVTDNCTGGTQMSLYEDKHKLFANYRKELDKFYGSESSPDEVRKACDEYINSKKCTWKNIFDPDTNHLVGFLIIGKEPPERHYQTDRCIDEAYVLPEYRGRGLMTAQIKDYESRHRCRWGYFVVQGNEYAREYWEWIFREMEYRPVELDGTAVIDHDGLLELFGWEPA